jgi:hypothetical protein
MHYEKINCMFQCYRQDRQPLGLHHPDTTNVTVLQSITIMQQNQTILTLVHPTGGAEGADRDADAVGGLSKAVQYELLN